MGLTESELRDWLENIANTNRMRKEIIYDLVRHANEDHMSEDDRTDCKRALSMLSLGKIPDRPGPIRVVVTNADEMWPEQ